VFSRPGPGAREIRHDIENTGLILEQREFYYGFIEEVKTNLVNELRSYFRDNPRTATYRWAGKQVGSGQVETDLERTKIHLAVEFSDLPQKYPSVLISAVQARIRDLWFNSPTHRFYCKNPAFSADDKAAAIATGLDYDLPEFLMVGERLTGRLDFTVMLTVRALAEAELDRIADLVLHGLLGQIRINLGRIGMAWIPEQGSTSGTQIEQLSNRQAVHARTISIGLRTDWYDDFYYQAVNIADVQVTQINRQGPPQL
jgi:hypothetical protein